MYTQHTVSVVHRPDAIDHVIVSLGNPPKVTSTKLKPPVVDMLSGSSNMAVRKELWGMFTEDATRVYELTCGDTIGQEEISSRPWSRPLRRRRFAA